MDSLSTEVLHKIFSYCDIGDRLLSLNLVNSRFRDVPYYDLKTLDVAYLAKLSRRLENDNCWAMKCYFESVATTLRKYYPQSGPRPQPQPPRLQDVPAATTCDAKVHFDYEKFLLTIFNLFLPKVGGHLETVHFAGFNDSTPTLTPEEMSKLSKLFRVGRRGEIDKKTATRALEMMNASRLPPIEPNVLLLLLKFSPKIKRIEFGNWPVRIEALKLLPAFKNLSHLTVFGVERNFEPILRRLSLTSLRIGGKLAPVKTGDPTRMRELILEKHPLPRTQTIISDFFPNLETLHIRTQFDAEEEFVQICAFLNPDVGGNVYVNFDQRVNYFNRFKNLRKSNLFGSATMNLPNMVTFKAKAVPFVEHVRVCLPKPRGHLLNVIEEQMVEEARVAIRAWPEFLAKFRVIKSLTISNKNCRFDVSALDLFHVTQLETLRALVLDGLDMTPMDATSTRYLEKIQQHLSAGGAGVDDASLRVRCQGLRRLAVKYWNQFEHVTEAEEMTATNEQQSMQILDVFVRFLLFKCSGIKELELSTPSKEEWDSLINYSKRLGDDCPLKKLRIVCSAFYCPIDFESLGGTQWPRLTELELTGGCGGTGYRRREPSVLPSKIAKVASSFPKLEVFSWPFDFIRPLDGKKYVAAVLASFPLLREFTFYDDVSPKLFREIVGLVAAQPRLEKLEFKLSASGKTVEVKKMAILDRLHVQRVAFSSMQGWRPKPIKVFLEGDYEAMNFSET